MVYLLGVQCTKTRCFSPYVLYILTMDSSSISFQNHIFSFFLASSWSPFPLIILSYPVFPGSRLWDRELPEGLLGRILGRHTYKKEKKAGVGREKKLTHSEVIAKSEGALELE